MLAIKQGKDIERMTLAARVDITARAGSQTLYPVAVFVSAALVFMVQPMVAKLVLPLLGGSPAVWNTCVVFFQGALLLGYAYAHILQRIRSLQTQAAVHLALLALAGLTLPLRISGALGEPTPEAPILWLLGVLLLTIGAPFAVLSATAPLIQAWFARSQPTNDAPAEPYRLYAASNLGSLLALFAYPFIIEPTTSLQIQRLGWSVTYAAFGGLILWLAWSLPKLGPAAARIGKAVGSRVAVEPMQRLRWVILAAIPSSLMMGTTTHLSTDVAAAPFLWVIPLALYLVTFIVAFQAKPGIQRSTLLMFQAAAIAVCIKIIPTSGDTPMHTVGLLIIHLTAFFLSALICHQALVDRRPGAANLTEFYMYMSLGGVLGAAFNAFLAPMLFEQAYEYPLLLVLSCLVHPWGNGAVTRKQALTLAFGLATSTLALGLYSLAPKWTSNLPIAVITGLLGCTVVSVFMLRHRAWLMACAAGALVVGTFLANPHDNLVVNRRSFFGIVRILNANEPGLGGAVRVLAHGSTIHGAQALDPKFRCRPLLYYAPTTPIGQVFKAAQARPSPLRIGAVGLGAGSVAAYTRPGDQLTFFEIDPMVVKIATDPALFSYTTECAKGQVDYVVGDARLTMNHKADALYDVMLLDAFSSDSIPAHLMTVEAMRSFLRHLKPDGVMVVHLSNRNLNLLDPAQAVALAAGGKVLVQRYRQTDHRKFWLSNENAIVIGKTDAALAVFARDARWKSAKPGKPWTDDYSNLIGALVSVWIDPSVAR